MKNEEDIYQKIAQIIVRSCQNPQNGAIRRAFHADGHVWLCAHLKILDGLPENVAHGIFAQGATYPALVRISSGFTDSRLAPDSRGLAVKLFNVPGPRMEGEEKANGLNEQDLLALNALPFFFVEMKNALEVFQQLDGFPRQKMFRKIVESIVLQEMRLRPKLLDIPWQPILDFFLKGGLSTITYNSITPFRLGPQGVMKYLFQPHPLPPWGSLNKNWSKDLGERFKEKLQKKGRVEFTLIVQPRTSERESLEDINTPWKSPLMEVGRLIIPSQKFADPKIRKIAEQTFFSPYNGLEAHRPLGKINQLRGAVYRASSLKRQAAPLQQDDLNAILQVLKGEKA